MEIKRYVCNPFRENTYLVCDECSKKAILIDPGFYTESEFFRLSSFVQENGYQISRILNTHMHLDHCVGNVFLKAFGLDAECGLGDLPLVKHAEDQARKFGLEIPSPIPEPEKFLKEGDEIQVGNILLQIIEVPGHSPGSLAFYSPEGFVFSGDVVFAGGGYGRTDLPGGNEDVLMDSIRKLLRLPGETRILCGHGPDTTVATELAIWKSRT